MASKKPTAKALAATAVVRDRVPLAPMVPPPFHDFEYNASETPELTADRLVHALHTLLRNPDATSEKRDYTNFHRDYFIDRSHLDASEALFDGGDIMNRVLSPLVSDVEIYHSETFPKAVAEALGQRVKRMAMVSLRSYIATPGVASGEAFVHSLRVCIRAYLLALASKYSRLPGRFDIPQRVVVMMRGLEPADVAEELSTIPMEGVAPLQSAVDAFIGFGLTQAPNKPPTSAGVVYRQRAIRNANGEKGLSVPTIVYECCVVRLDNEPSVAAELLLSDAKKRIDAYYARWIPESAERPRVEIHPKVHVFSAPRVSGLATIFKEQSKSPGSGDVVPSVFSRGRFLDSDAGRSSFWFYLKPKADTSASWEEELAFLRGQTPDALKQLKRSLSNVLSLRTKKAAVTFESLDTIAGWFATKHAAELDTDDIGTIIKNTRQVCDGIVLVEQERLASSSESGNVSSQKPIFADDGKTILYFDTVEDIFQLDFATNKKLATRGKKLPDLSTASKKDRREFYLKGRPDGLLKDNLVEASIAKFSAEDAQRAIDALQPYVSKFKEELINNEATPLSNKAQEEADAMLWDFLAQHYAKPRVEEKRSFYDGINSQTIKIFKRLKTHLAATPPSKQTGKGTEKLVEEPSSSTKKRGRPKKEKKEVDEVTPDPEPEPESKLEPEKTPKKKVEATSKKAETPKKVETPKKDEEEPKSEVSSSADASNIDITTLMTNMETYFVTSLIDSPPAPDVEFGNVRYNQFEAAIAVDMVRDDLEAFRMKLKSKKNPTDEYRAITTHWHRDVNVPNSGNMRKRYNELFAESRELLIQVLEGNNNILVDLIDQRLSRLHEEEKVGTPKVSPAKPPPGNVNDLTRSEEPTNPPKVPSPKVQPPPPQQPADDLDDLEAEASDPVIIQPNKAEKGSGSVPIDSDEDDVFSDAADDDDDVFSDAAEEPSTHRDDNTLNNKLDADQKFFIRSLLDALQLIASAEEFIYADNLQTIHDTKLFVNPGPALDNIWSALSSIVRGLDGKVMPRRISFHARTERLASLAAQTPAPLTRGGAPYRARAWLHQLFRNKKFDTADAAMYFTMRTYASATFINPADILLNKMWALQAAYDLLAEDPIARDVIPWTAAYRAVLKRNGTANDFVAYYESFTETKKDAYYHAPYRVSLQQHWRRSLYDATMCQLLPFATKVAGTVAHLFALPETYRPNATVIMTEYRDRGPWLFNSKLQDSVFIEATANRFMTVDSRRGTDNSTMFAWPTQFIIGKPVDVDADKGVRLTEVNDVEIPVMHPDNKRPETQVAGLSSALWCVCMTAKLDSLAIYNPWMLVSSSSARWYTKNPRVRARMDYEMLPIRLGNLFETWAVETYTDNVIITETTSREHMAHIISLFLAYEAHVGKRITYPSGTLEVKFATKSTESLEHLERDTTNRLQRIVQGTSSSEDFFSKNFRDAFRHQQERDVGNNTVAAFVRQSLDNSGWIVFYGDNEPPEESPMKEVDV